MGHDHDHHHQSGNSVDLVPAFRWAVGLNSAYVVAELIAGFLTNSLALYADAAHNLTDVAGLLIAWAATVLATRARSQRFSWGLGRATILAALGNAMAILVGVGIVIWEAVWRFQSPVVVPGFTVMLVAAIGIAVNGGTAMLFASSRKTDLNAHSAYLHMATDAAVSGAVVLSALLMALTGWVWLDPGIAIVVSLLIALTSWRLLLGALHLGLDGVPAGVEPGAISNWIAGQPGVEDVHDLHIWALSTTRTALSVHVVRRGEEPDDFLARLNEGLAHDFGIAHTTVQLERVRCPATARCPA